MVKRDPKTRKRQRKNIDSLRDRAERLLEQDLSSVPPRDVATVIHELQVHQIELQMQNEELRRAQEDLEESRNRYFELYDLAPVGYITMDTSGVILECNLAGADMLGMARSRLQGKLFRSFVLPDDLSLFDACFDRLLKEKEKDSCELRLKKKGQASFCCMENLCIRDRKGSPTAIRSALIDVTEQKRIEEDLERANERFATLAENSPDIISRRDKDLRCSYINPAIEAYTGISRSEFLGHILEETTEKGWYPPGIKEVFVEVLRTGKEKAAEFEYDTMKGRRDFHAVVIPETGRDGSVESVLAVARDITGLKQTQKELEKRVQERTADLERTNLELVEEIRKRERFEKAFRESTEKIVQEAEKRRMMSARLMELLERDRRDTAMALHDHLGQLLTTVKMELEMMEAAEQADARALLGHAKQQIAEAIRFGRDATNQLRPVGLDTLGLVPSLETLTHEFSESFQGVTISFFSRPLSSALGKDKELVLYRVAQEAIMNALKHASPTNIFVNLIARKGIVSLTVEDDGKGFNYEQKSLSPDGALGIGIMKERLNQVGGKLRIESHFGKGTEVIAEVPVEEC